MKDFVRKFLPFLCVAGGFALVTYSCHIQDNSDIIVLTTGFLLVVTGSWMKQNDDNNNHNTSVLN